MRARGASSKEGERYARGDASSLGHAQEREKVTISGYVSAARGKKNRKGGKANDPKELEECGATRGKVGKGQTYRK